MSKIIFCAQALVAAGDGALLGHVVVPAGIVVREHFEVAAWFRDHELQAGRYPLRVSILPRSSYWCLGAVAEVTSKIADAYMASLFGGVPVTGRNSASTEVGKASSRTLGRRAAYFEKKVELWFPAGIEVELAQGIESLLLPAEA